MPKATKLKERSILFDNEQIKAILAGRKTQTRRVFSPQPPSWVTAFGYSAVTPDGYISGRGIHPDGPAEKFFPLKYGKPGDRLWVQEAFVENYSPDMPVAYRADWGPAAERYLRPPKWIRAISMPRRVARLFLEITDIRVERLQDISEDDAYTSGVGSIDAKRRSPDSPVYRNTYRERWDFRTRPAYCWSSNPWVWVISFRMVQP
jgi:hypothetical protein